MSYVYVPILCHYIISSVKKALLNRQRIKYESDFDCIILFYYDLAVNDIRMSLLELLPRCPKAQWLSRPALYEKRERGGIYKNEVPFGEGGKEFMKDKTFELIQILIFYLYT